jgi:mRNA-degrading endonuclease RelE of RelBE toxin-antitoxin system
MSSSMSFEVRTIKPFERQAKRLLKKYPSLKEELFRLLESLRENPAQGSPIGHGCFKLRLSIASKGKGKSGGARVITHLTVQEGTVYLLSIYDKSELSSLTDVQIKALLKLIR